MKALFITAPSDTPFQTWYPPLGIAYISAYLKQACPEWQTACCDAALGEAPLAAVKGYKPDVIGITCTTLGYMNAVKIAKLIKEHYPDVPIVLGGQHISALPHTLKAPFDVCVVGEGEQAFVRICREIEQYGRLSTDKYVGVKVKNLDTLPFPDREMFNMRTYLQPQAHWVDAYGRGTSMFTSRGCPYACVFCASARFWGKPVRGNFSMLVVDEMEMLVDKYKIEFLNFFDDLFHYDKQRLRNVVKEVKTRGVNLRIGIQAHAPTFDEETACLCAEMGVEYVGFGFESASPKLLEFLKCGVATLDHARSAIKNARKYGMKVGSGFMCNVPGETEADVKANEDFIREQKLDSYSFYVLTPYPGTPLWDYALKKGLVSDDMDFTRIYQTENGKNVKLTTHVCR